MVENRKKIVVVGDENCGKTTLLNRIRQRDYSTVYIPTIFEIYEIDLEIGSQRYDLSFHDIAGSEDLARLRPLAYHEADVILLCFNIDSINSFQNCVDKWYKEVSAYCPNTPHYLVGCKKDLRPFTYTAQSLPQVVERNAVSYEEGVETAKQIQASGYHECSAKSNEGIRELLEAIVTDSKISHSDHTVHKGKELLFCAQCKLPIGVKAVCQDCFEWEIQKPHHRHNNSTGVLQDYSKVVQLNDKVEEVAKKVSDLETRLDTMTDRLSVRIGSIENCLTELANNYRLATTLKEMSEKVVSIENCFNFLDEHTTTKKIGDLNLNSSFEMTTRKIGDLNLNSSFETDKSSFFTSQSKNFKLSNEMMRKLLETQSRLCTVLCTGFEENGSNDLRVLKMIANKLNLNPNDMVNCTRLGLPSSDYIRDAKIRFVSPEAATKFLTTPKDAIRFDRRYKSIRFTTNCSEEQEKEARDLWLELKSLSQTSPDPLISQTSQDPLIV